MSGYVETFQFDTGRGDRHQTTRAVHPVACSEIRAWESEWSGPWVDTVVYTSQDAKVMVDSYKDVTVISLENTDYMGRVRVFLWPEQVEALRAALMR